MLQKIQDYLNSRILLLKLEISEKTAEALAVLFSKIVLLMFFVLFIGFASITGAFAIAEKYDSFMLGFAIITAFYLLVVIVFFAFRKTLLVYPFMNKMIKIFFSESDGKEKESKDKQ